MWVRASERENMWSNRLTKINMWSKRKTKIEIPTTKTTNTKIKCRMTRNKSWLDYLSFDIWSFFWSVKPFRCAFCWFVLVNLLGCHKFYFLRFLKRRRLSGFESLFFRSGHWSAVATWLQNIFSYLTQFAHIGGPSSGHSVDELLHNAYSNLGICTSRLNVQIFGSSDTAEYQHTRTLGMFLVRRWVSPSISILALFSPKFCDSVTTVLLGTMSSISYSAVGTTVNTTSFSFWEAFTPFIMLASDCVICCWALIFVRNYLRL